jgi:hypothetical protein
MSVKHGHLHKAYLLNALDSISVNSMESVKLKHNS